MSGGKGKGQMQSIDLTKLNLMQLNQLKHTLEQDLQLYQDSIQNLKLAQTKFQDSGDCLKKLSGDLKDKDILVPLTGSMYVPGTLTDPERVIVDVGTGYFVEKNVNEAKEYFNRKVKFVTEQMEKVQALGNDKSRVREAILEVMEAKVQMQMAAQQRAASGAAAAE